MKVFPHVIQGSEEWFAMRRGRATASRFSDIVTAKECKLSKSADRYIYELIADCFTTDVTGWTGNRWTDRGTELEPEAREAFAARTGLNVVQVGFVAREERTPGLYIVGCSPDCLITDPASLDYIAGGEIKCLSPKEHVAVVAGGVLPDDHKQQVHGSMVVTGLPEWHFFSHCPGMEPFHIVTQRDEYTRKLAAGIDEFIIRYAELRAALMPKLVRKAA